MWRQRPWCGHQPRMWAAREAGRAEGQIAPQASREHGPADTRTVKPSSAGSPPDCERTRFGCVELAQPWAARTAGGPTYSSTLSRGVGEGTGQEAAWEVKEQGKESTNALGFQRTLFAE